MTNFAWANPTTGVRRQAATLEAARHEAWEELQEDRTGAIQAVIYEQERVGIAGMATASWEIHESWGEGYAGASPKDGRRFYRSTWTAAVELVRELLGGMQEPPQEVVIYRQRAATIVYSTDPEPAAPVPLLIEDNTPASLIRDVLAGTCYDPGRAQLLAMLWIAEGVQKLAHELSPPEPMTHAFRFSDGELCGECGLPMNHPAHGYTGD